MFRQVGNHVVFTSFTSGICQLHRTDSTTLGRNHGVTIFNHDVRGTVATKRRLNCLRVPRSTLVSRGSVGDCPPRGIVVVYANSRNRPVTTLDHVTGNARQRVTVRPNSAIIFSSGPVPNGAADIGTLVGGLRRSNTRMVRNCIGGVRASNRNNRISRRLVLHLVGPGFFTPIRNRCQVRGVRAGLTRLANMPVSRDFILTGNSILTLAGSAYHITSRVRATDSICVSNHSTNSAINGPRVHRQQVLSRRKMIATVTIISLGSCRVITKPSVISQKFICVRRSRRLVGTTGRRIF